MKIDMSLNKETKLNQILVFIQQIQKTDESSYI